MPTPVPNTANKTPTDANDSPSPPPQENADANDPKYILPPRVSCQIDLYKSNTYVPLQFEEFDNNAGLHIRSGMTGECRWNDVPPVESWCCRSSEWEVCHVATDPNKVSIFGREYSPKTPECHLWCSGRGDDCFTFIMDPQSIEEQAGASCLWTSEGFLSVLGSVIGILACVGCVGLVRLMLRVALWIRGLCCRRATPAEKFFVAPMEVVAPPRTVGKFFVAGMEVIEEDPSWYDEASGLTGFHTIKADNLVDTTSTSLYRMIKAHLPHVELRPGLQGEHRTSVRCKWSDEKTVKEAIMNKLAKPMKKRVKLSSRWTQYFGEDSPDTDEEMFF
jgi:hypothetical protein